MAIRSGSYIRITSKGDREPIDPKGTTIVLSAFASCKQEQPIIERSDRSFAVAMSDHGDLGSTIEFVRRSGAKRVITDNSRGRGIELAETLRQILNVDARPSSNRQSLLWGE
jgi:hypothetical protein